MSASIRHRHVRPVLVVHRGRLAQIHGYHKICRKTYLMIDIRRTICQARRRQPQSLLDELASTP